MSISEQLRALPRYRAKGTKPTHGMIQLDLSAVRALRRAAVEHDVAMGRVAEFAIERLLAELAAQNSATEQAA